MWRLCCIQWDLKPNSWIKYLLEWYLHGECWPIPVNKKTAKSHSRSIKETWNVDLRFTTSGSLFETGCMFQDCTYRQWNPMTALNIFFPDPFFAPVNLWQGVLYVSSQPVLCETGLPQLTVKLSLNLDRSHKQLKKSRPCPDFVKQWHERFGSWCWWFPIVIVIVQWPCNNVYILVSTDWLSQWCSVLSEFSFRNGLVFVIFIQECVHESPQAFLHKPLWPDRNAKGS